ncbi:MAG TPA: HDOD domain-containing protein [Terriglobales bacterium]|nr:HDOD domain-containing protein [Terriglobales bacterium]
MSIPLQQVAKEIQQIESMPSVSAILQPLIGHLQQPLERVDTQRVVDLIASDNSLAAQCLHMANSPLFGRWQAITTVRGAVIALGMQRMRDIALSCSMLRLFPSKDTSKGPIVCWEHSLACALVCRRIARRLGYDLENAYLAGLLHDLGMVFQACTYPGEFEAVLALCTQSRVPVCEAEMRIFGFTHTDTGRMLAESWNLSGTIVDAIRAHHSLSNMVLESELVGIVHLSDRLCRTRGVGYGIEEQAWFDSPNEPSLEQLQEYYPLLKTVNTARLFAEVDTYINDVRKLVTALYHLN